MFRQLDMSGTLRGCMIRNFTHSTSKEHTPLLRTKLDIVTTVSQSSFFTFEYSAASSKGLLCNEGELNERVHFHDKHVAGRGVAMSLSNI